MCMSCWAEMCGLERDGDSFLVSDVPWAPVSDEMRSLVLSIRAFREMPECELGGPIHCEIEDDNLEDEFLSSGIELGRDAWGARANAPHPLFPDGSQASYSPEVLDAAWSILERFQSITLAERATVQAMESGWSEDALVHVA